MDKRPVGRPKGVKWDKITRLTIRLYDAEPTDLAKIRGFVKQIQDEIRKRKSCDKK
jgi:hypothetical protein